MFFSIKRETLWILCWTIYLRCSDFYNIWKDQIFPKLSPRWTSEILESFSIQVEDLYTTVLYNDEVHTFDEVITTLQRAVDNCDRNQAIRFLSPSLDFI